MRWPIESYSDRLWFAVNGAATSAGTVQMTAALTGLDTRFWQKVQADLDDIRLYAADGVTAYQYDIAALSYVDKTVTIEAQGVAHHVTNTLTLLQFAYGNSTATDGKTAIVPAGALTGYTLNTGPAPGEPIFTLENPLDETTPTQRLRKREDETVFAWFQIGPLGMLDEPYNGRLFGEGPQSLAIIPPSPGTLVANTSAIRVWQAQNGALLARATITAGTTATDYDVVFVVYTTEGRILNAVVRVSVLD